MRLNVPSIGIDLVRIKRFVAWRKYSQKALAKLFTEGEISSYNLFLKTEQFLKADQFLASRYAGKEAFYKAYCGLLEGDLGEDKVKAMPFLTIASSFAILGYSENKLQLYVDWQKLLPDALELADSLIVRASLSHESCCSVAVVQILRA